MDAYGFFDIIVALIIIGILYVTKYWRTHD